MVAGDDALAAPQHPEVKKSRPPSSGAPVRAHRGKKKRGSERSREALPFEFVAAPHTIGEGCGSGGLQPCSSAAIASSSIEST